MVSRCRCHPFGGAATYTLTMASGYKYTMYNDISGGENLRCACVLSASEHQKHKPFLKEERVCAHAGRTTPGAPEGFRPRKRHMPICRIFRGALGRTRTCDLLCS